MVIFAVALHQEVTGFSTNDPNKIMAWLLKEMNASHDLETEVAKKSLLNINVDAPELLKYSPLALSFIKMANDWKDNITLIENLYRPLWYSLTNIAQNRFDSFNSEILKKIHEIHVMEDKDTKNQSTLENVSVNKTIRDELYNFTLELELGILNYEEMIKNLEDIVSCVTRYIIKDKAVKDESTTSENVPLDADELIRVLACIHVKLEPVKLHRIAMIKHMAKVLDSIKDAEKNINTRITKDEKKGGGIPEDFLKFYYYEV